MTVFTTEVREALLILLKIVRLLRILLLFFRRFFDSFDFRCFRVRLGILHGDIPARY